METRTLVINSIYENIGDPQAMAHTIQKLVAYNDSMASQFGFIDLSGRWVQASVVGVDPAGLELYMRHHVTSDPRTTFALRHPGKFFTDGQMVENVSAFESSALVELLDRFECRFMMGAYFAVSHDYFGGLSLMRPRRQKQYAVEHLRKASSVLPHLKRAMGLHVRLGRLESQETALERLVDRLSTPVLLVDAAGTIRYANAAGHKELRQASLLVLKNGRVEPRNVRQTPPFAQLLAAAVFEESNYTVMRLHGDNGHMAVLTAYSLRGLPGLVGMPQAAAVVFVTYPDMGERVDALRLQMVYGLTPAETRLVEHLARGENLADIAEKLRLSRETLKSQLRSLFAKTGTNRQAELVAVLLSAFSFPLA